MRRLFGGLRARLLIIVVIAVLPMVGLLFVYASAQNNAAQDRERSEVQRNLLNDVSSIQDLVAESRATLVTFGITYAIQHGRSDLAQGNADRLKALHPDYAVIAIADPNGRIIVSSTDQTGSVNVAGAALFDHAVSSRTLSISGYQIDPVIRRPTISVSLPVFDAAGKLIAVEYIGIEPAQFGSRLSAANSPYSTELIIDGNGTVIARQPMLKGVEGKLLPSADLVRIILAGKRGTTTTAGLDGLTRQYFYAPIFEEPQGTLYLATGFSEAQLFAGQRQAFQFTLVGFGVFGLLALAIAGFVGTFSIYRPVRQLEDTAERVTAGEMSARSEVSSRGDEIGALGRAFNNMAESIESHVHELETAQGELSAMNAELETRVRRRTAELEASNRELEAFNYSVSHDLRAPLRAIDGFSDALLEDYRDKLDAVGRDYLDRVKAAANRMGDLIDSLLTLSRLTRCEMNLQPVDLSALATQVVEELRQREPDRSVEVVVQPDVSGECDAVLWRAVLENLLGNAWKFTGRTQTARIEFATKDVDGETVYFVRDNGAGFDMAYSNKLFSAFQRLHGQSEFPGIGVGLATVSRIVWRHGGRIWAEGALGEGATFYFTLP